MSLLTFQSKTRLSSPPKFSLKKFNEGSIFFLNASYHLPDIKWSDSLFENSRLFTQLK
jgi:hypothetical protein